MNQATLQKRATARRKQRRKRQGMACREVRFDRDSMVDFFDQLPIAELRGVYKACIQTIPDERPAHLKPSFTHED